MSYFSKFPTFKYPITINNETISVLVRNLLRRCALSDEMRQDNAIFIEYHVKDGERPEHIAERIYGDAGLHWIILLTNTTIDPYHGWYMSQGVLETYLQTKYSGYSVFFTDVSGVGGSVFYSSDIQTGSTLSQGGVSAIVKDFQSQLCKLVVSGSAFSIGPAILTGISGATHGIELRKILKSMDALNYFRIIKPASDIDTQEQVVVDPLSESIGLYHQSVNGYTNLGNLSVSFKDTYLGKYMGVGGGMPTNQYSVSNLTFESEKNEKKRVIKILHPRFKDQAIKELEKLLSV